jgi:HEAT repeat protein
MPALTLAAALLVALLGGDSGDAALAHEVVMRALADEDYEVRHRALTVVSIEDLPDAREPLMRLRSAKHLGLAQAAENTLRRCGLEPQAPAELPGEEGALVRAREARDLAALRRLATSSDDTIAVGAAAAIRATGEAPPRPRILERLREPQPPLRAIQAAALVPFDEDTPELRRLLASRDEAVRAEAAHALGVRRDAASFDALQRLLSDDEDVVRVAAIAALADLGDARARPALAAALHDRRIDVQLDAALALHRLGDRTGTERILADAVGGAEGARAAACVLLPRLDARDALPALRSAMRDRSVRVAIEAVASWRRVASGDAR